MRIPPKEMFFYFPIWFSVHIILILQGHLKDSGEFQRELVRKRMYDINEGQIPCVKRYETARNNT
jgi:hypothetical protein